MSLVMYSVFNPFDMSSLDASLNEIRIQDEFLNSTYYADRFRTKESSTPSRIFTYQAPHERHLRDADGDFCMPQAKPSVVIPFYDADTDTDDDTDDVKTDRADPYYGHHVSKYHTISYPMPLPDIDRSTPIPMVTDFQPIHSDLSLDQFMGAVYDILELFCATHGIEISEEGIEFHYMKIKVSFKTQFEFVRSKRCVGNTKNELNFSYTCDASQMYHTAVDALVLEEVTDLYGMLLDAFTFDK